MKHAVIIHHSRTGVTAAFAAEIAGHLQSRGIAAQCLPLGPEAAQALAKADMVLLGCWTGGLFVALQRPAKAWCDFMATLPVLEARKAALFTTYKLATGGMFRRMRQALAGRVVCPSLELKARGNRLDAAHRDALDAWIGQA